MKPDNNTVALACVTAIIITAVLTGVADPNNVIIAGVSGILGWMAKGKE